MRIATIRNLRDLLFAEKDGEKIPDSIIDSWNAHNDGVDLHETCEEYEDQERGRKTWQFWGVVGMVGGLAVIAAAGGLSIISEEALFYGPAAGFAAIVAVIGFGVWKLNERRSPGNQSLRAMLQKFCDELNEVSTLTGRLPTAFEQMEEDEIAALAKPVIVEQCTNVLLSYSERGYPTAETAQALKDLSEAYNLFETFDIEPDLDDCFEAAKGLAAQERLDRKARERELETRRREQEEERQRAAAVTNDVTDDDEEPPVQLQAVNN